MLLQHLEGLAKTAYSSISSNPEESSSNMVKEYSKELDADVQIIKKVAVSFNQDATAGINRYQAEYEMHLTVWLNALSKCVNTTPAGLSEETVPPDLQQRNRKAENKFKRFREWRDKAMKGIQRKFLPKTTPVTELDSAKANLEEREKRQRLMKKANAIIRSQREVTPRLIELLGPGSEEETARIQKVAEQQENVGFSAHELNNNNANIFRLKRRVKELERKIGMMQLRNEETKEMNGVRIIHNYGADRIQLFFTEKPVSARLRQLKGNGWHWSPSAGCWQRKITESARKSATCIYKGEISEEYMNMPAPVAGISKEVKKKVKIKKESVSKKEVKSVAESVVESLPVAESVAAVESVIAPKSKVIVESKAATIKVAVVSSVAGSIKKTEDPIAKKKEEVIEKEEKINSKASKREITKKEKVAAKRELKREIIIKPKTELKAEKKPEEKPKAIDWAKIASQVERSGEPEVIIEPKQTSKPENETSAGGYSYEAYID